MHELPQLVQLVKMVKVAETVKLDNRHKVAKLIQLAKMVKWAETAHVLINSCENGVCIVNFLRNISEIW